HRDRAGYVPAGSWAAAGQRSRLIRRQPARMSSLTVPQGPGPADGDLTGISLRGSGHFGAASDLARGERPWPGRGKHQGPHSRLPRCPPADLRSLGPPPRRGSDTDAIWWFTVDGPGPPPGGPPAAQVLGAPPRRA